MQTKINFNKKTGIVVGAIAIALMLSVGMSLATSNKPERLVVSRLPTLTIDEIHDECPCKELSEKLREYLISYDGLGDFNFSELPEPDPQLLCEAYNDDEIYAEMLDMARSELLGCGFGYAISTPGQSNGQSSGGNEAPIKFDGPVEIGGGESISSLPTIKLYEYTRTVNETLYQIEMIRNICDGLEWNESWNGSGTQGPFMQWELHRAVVWCSAFVLSWIQVPIYVIHSVIWLLTLGVCLDAMAYMGIAQILDSFDVSVYQVFTVCVEFLTGQPFEG